MMRFTLSVSPRPSGAVALLAVLLIAAVIAAFFALNSSISNTTRAQSYTKFIAVDGLYNTICAIKESDGNPVCWGFLDFKPIEGFIPPDSPKGGGLLPTDGGYKSVFSGFKHQCALKANGTATCWGESPSKRLDYDDMDLLKYHEIGFDNYHACWLQRDDTTDANDQKLGCAAYHTGAWYKYAAVVPTKIQNYEFEIGSLIMREWHSCALVKDSDRNTTGNQNQGTIECWGHAPHFPTNPTGVTFKQIGGGEKHICGIVRDGDTGVAGIQDEDTIQCWGDPWDFKLNAPTGTTFKSLSVGGDHSCGLVKDNDASTTGNQGEDTIKCWGNNSENQTASPIGTYKGLISSEAHNYDGLMSYSCAITIDSNPGSTGNQQNGALACWGGLQEINKNSASYRNPLDEDTNIPGVHSPTPTATPTPPRDVIKSLSTGSFSLCMVMEAGQVYCGGRNAFGETQPPDGTRVRSVSMGRTHACGISHYGDNVVCWGDKRWGAATPPDGAFKNVSAGEYATCGVKIDGSIACWGTEWPADNGLLSGIPTDSDFVTVKLGGFTDSAHAHACALDEDGNVTCWGRDDEGQTTVPANMTFKAIDAGDNTSCGIVQDSDTTNQTADENEDTVRCWGTGREHTVTPIDKTRHSIKDFPQTHTVNNASSDLTFKEIVTSRPVTCGILDENWVDLRTRPLYSILQSGYSVNNVSKAYPRKADTPYCQGQRSSYHSGPDHSYSAQPWNPSYPSHRYKRYFPSIKVIPGDIGSNSRDVYTYRGIDTSGFYTCAIRSDGNVVCDGQYAYHAKFPPPVTPVPTETVSIPDTLTCGTAPNTVTYNVAAASITRRFPTTGGDYYVSIPPAALEDGKLIGVRIDEGTTDLDFEVPDTVHPVTEQSLRVLGKPYPVTVKKANDPNKCTNPSPALTITRPVDVCIAKPSGRLSLGWDWRVYEINTTNDGVVGSAMDGWTDLGNKVCGEVTKLPITVAAASRPLPRQNAHYGNPALDLIAQTPIPVTAETDTVYVRIRGTTLPTGGSWIDIQQANVAPEDQLNLSADLFRVGDVYYEINLRDFDDKDISPPIKFNPKAEICIKVPAGFEKVIHHRADGSTTWNTLDPLTDKSHLVGEYERYAGDDYVCGVTDSLSTFVSTGSLATATPTHTPTPTATPLALPDIFRIAPRISSITVSAGDKVRLGVDVYGLQNLLDNSLAVKHDITFQWSATPSGGSFEEADYYVDDDIKADDREVIYTAPAAAGEYTIKAFVHRQQCGDDEGLDDGCEAEIMVSVRALEATPEPTAVPINPAGEIPLVIVDSDGNKYEVFTPVDGGEFIGDNVSVIADPGAVPNLQIIGIRAVEDGPASNVGQTDQRMTLEGNYFDVYAVDASGQLLTRYILDDPLEVCIPVPQQLVSELATVAMSSVQDDGSLTVLSSKFRITDSGVRVCAALGIVSARVSAGYLGSPSALPSPTPLPTPEDPDTGGNHIPTNAYLLLILLGAALATMSYALVRGRH